MTADTAAACMLKAGRRGLRAAASEAPDLPGVGGGGAGGHSGNGFRGVVRDEAAAQEQVGAARCQAVAEHDADGVVDLQAQSRVWESAARQRAAQADRQPADGSRKQAHSSAAAVRQLTAHASSASDRQLMASSQQHTSPSGSKQR